MKKYPVDQISKRSRDDKHTQEHCGTMPFDIPVKLEEQENKTCDRDHRENAQKDRTVFQNSPGRAGILDIYDLEYFVDNGNIPSLRNIQDNELFGKLIDTGQERHAYEREQTNDHFVSFQLEKTSEIQIPGKISKESLL